MYNIQSLKQGIEAAKSNITTFETAIDGEKKTIAEYRIIIADLEKKEKDGS